MKHLKKVVIRGFFVLEIVLFAGHYIWGERGSMALAESTRECSVLAQTLIDARSDYTRHMQELESWQKETFYKEKVAREQLQMARSGDLIFYIS